jgi:hypothetical protein
VGELDRHPYLWDDRHIRIPRKIRRRRFVRQEKIRQASGSASARLAESYSRRVESAAESTAERRVWRKRKTAVARMNILVIGERGQGKSTLALFLAERIQERIGTPLPVVIFDPKRTFVGIPHTDDLGVFEDMLENPDGARAIAFQPGINMDADDDADEMIEEFSSFFDTMGINYHLGVREGAIRNNLPPVVLIVDESWFLQGGNRAHPKLQWIVRLADKKNFYMIQCSHCPKDFAKRIRSQVDELYLFREWLPEDIDIVREWCGHTVADIVANLPNHHVVRYELGSHEYQVWTHPEGWFISIDGATDAKPDTRCSDGTQDGANDSAGIGGSGRDDAERVQSAERAA